jgi:hypothetical protein
MRVRSIAASSATGSLAFVTGMALAAADPTLNIAAGTTHSIEQGTILSQLVIADGAQLMAAANKSLTLTVNGVTTSIRPGTYSGKVVLTPTDEVLEQFNDMGANETYRYRTALYIDNGAVVPGKSVSAAVVGGKVDNSAAQRISITSSEDEFNGIWVTGNSNYTINHARINFTGNGGNDFAGFGAAIKTGGKAHVTINDAIINTRGVVRTAIFVGGDSVVTVNNSRIDVRNGTLPVGYKGGPITGSGGIMMEPPWVLGIVGNVRATNVVGNGEVHYINSVIRSQGWGALSTDATRNVKLFCKNSTVEVLESGYGAYADGVSLDTFSGCRIKVPDYGLIITGGSALFTDRSVVNSGRIGVMMHSGGSGTLTINKGSVLNTREAVFQPKSSFPKIVVDGAQLNSASGVILEAIINDDPIAGQMAARMAARGVGAGGSLFGGPPAGALPGGPPPGGRAGGPGGAPAPTGPRIVDASFSNMTIKGDIINAMTTLAGMKLRFANSHIAGGISTATATHSDGEPTAQYYQRVGRMKHNFQHTDGNNGIEVSLDDKSSWVITKTSYLTNLVLAAGARISAPKGYSLSASVDGKEVALTTGSIQGAIVLKVAKI